MWKPQSQNVQVYIPVVSGASNRHISFFLHSGFWGTRLLIPTRQEAHSWDGIRWRHHNWTKAEKNGWNRQGTLNSYQSRRRRTVQQLWLVAAALLAWVQFWWNSRPDGFTQRTKNNKMKSLCRFIAVDTKWHWVVHCNIYLNLYGVCQTPYRSSQDIWNADILSWQWRQSFKLETTLWYIRKYAIISEHRHMFLNSDNGCVECTLPATGVLFIGQGREKREREDEH